MSSYDEAPPPARGRWGRLGDRLRGDATGGLLLVAAALAALVLANSPASAGYHALAATEWGWPEWHLQLTLEQWVSDGLLAVFFFLIGLELKREFSVGALRDARTAIVPIVAALGGVVLPAGIFLAVAAGDPGARPGWAIPVATDIAFAIAILALVGPRLPRALRLFLLTLAVVDDLIGIALIALLSAKAVDLVALGIAGILLCLFGLLAHLARHRLERRPAWALLILLPIALACWVAVHASGIHATIAGVALGLVVPVLSEHQDERHGLAHQFEHALRPLSAGIVVPAFAFFAAGVSVGGVDGLGDLVGQRVFWAIVLALVLGKPLGILAATWLLTRLSSARLDRTVRWRDLAGVGALAGIGFTVSLLIASISFGPASTLDRASIFAVLVGSLVSALVAVALLAPRNRSYRGMS